MGDELVTKEELIADLVEVSGKCPEGVTRDFYRSNGKYSERQVSKHFPKFSDFLQAANLIVPDEVVTEKNEITADTWSIELPKTRICTLDELVKYCKIDLNVWEVERFVANKWEVGAKNKFDELVIKPLFQVKAFLKKKVAVLAIKRELEDLKKLAKTDALVREPVIRSTTKSGNMLEINIPDSHFGKLAWGVETGYNNYDTKIAAKTFIKAFDTLLHRVSGHKFDQILFIVGNDLLNSDNIENTTTKGTAVTTDGRYHKTFALVRTTIIECIKKLRVIAPVKVMMVAGNHDSLSVWHLGDSLECYFHNDPEVEIDNSPKYRKYHKFGKVMLMFTHGDKAKKDDYPLLMATEQSMMFGSTKFREAHCGHTHETKLNEKHGVRVRVLPALCEPDDWHSENGFVGNLRNAEAFVWNKDEGLVAMAFYCDDAQRED